MIRPTKSRSSSQYHQGEGAQQTVHGITVGGGACSRGPLSVILMTTTVVATTAAAPIRILFRIDVVFDFTLTLASAETFVPGILALIVPSPGVDPAVNGALTIP